MEAARSKTPPDVLEKAESRDFLLQCLKRTKLDPDLLEDVADACELQDPALTALGLACGEVTAESAGDKLFLMHDEAKLLLGQCRTECLRIGVDFGDGSVFDPAMDAGKNVTVQHEKQYAFALIGVEVRCSFVMVLVQSAKYMSRQRAAPSASCIMEAAVRSAVPLTGAHQAAGRTSTAPPAHLGTITTPITRLPATPQPANRTPLPRLSSRSTMCTPLPILRIATVPPRPPRRRHTKPPHQLLLPWLPPKLLPKPQPQTLSCSQSLPWPSWPPPQPLLEGRMAAARAWAAPARSPTAPCPPRRPQPLRQRPPPVNVLPAQAPSSTLQRGREEPPPRRM